MVSITLRRRQRGAALITASGFMFLLAGSMAVYLSVALQGEMVAIRRQNVLVLQNAAESANETAMAAIYRDFKVNQSFTSIDASYSHASTSGPISYRTISLSNGASVSTTIIRWANPANQTRFITLRSTATMASAQGTRNNGTAPSLYVDQSFQLKLSQSRAFDYVEFEDNFLGHIGGATDHFFCGDIRSNGDVTLNGGITVNGSISAAINTSLQTPNQGLVSGYTTRYNASSYASTASSNGRIRPLYDAALFGTPDSTTYANIGTLAYDPDGRAINNTLYGSYRSDSTGATSITDTGSSTTLLTTQGTSSIVTPVLPSLATQISTSAAYIDQVQTYADGTTNPNYGQGAYVEVYNTTTKAYQRISSNGYVTSTPVLIGTSANPIRIHGPVTFANDIVIKGVVSGQGTLIAGRNVHGLGSITYKTPPDFRQTNSVTMLANAQKADMLGLVAQGSVILGRPDLVPSSAMSPPWTKSRVDAQGNETPAFNGNDIDTWGVAKIKSILGDSTITSLCESVNQVDAVIYSNHYLGGTLALGGGSFNINGALISQDEYLYLSPLMSGPWGGWKFIYDPRVKGRANNLGPIIDLNLPSSPSIQRTSWNRGPYSG